MSVPEKANAIALGVGFESAMFSLASYATAGSITALGGACLGFLRPMVESPLRTVEAWILGSDFHPDASFAQAALKTSTQAAVYFGSCLITWALLLLAGFPFPLSSVVVIAILTKAARIALSCLGLELPNMPSLPHEAYFSQGPHDVLDRILGAGDLYAIRLRPVWRNLLGIESPGAV